MRRILKFISFSFILCLWNVHVFSQNNIDHFSFWKLNSISGDVKLNGFYREEVRDWLGYHDLLKSNFLSGGLALRTNSYFLHPDFLNIELDAAYMPESSRNVYLVAPDLSEVQTIKKIGLGATFFNNKKLTLHIVGNYDDGYATRENLTNLRSINQMYGAMLSFNNRILPVYFDLYNRKWNQTEIQTGKSDQFNQSLFSARALKSITNYDRSELRYSHEINSNINQNLFHLNNTSDIIDFVNRLDFDKKQKYSLNTMISNVSQYGNLNWKRFQAFEFLNLSLPSNFSLLSNYQYSRIKQPQYSIDQQGISVGLEHRLYKSLRSHLNYEFNQIKHSLYRESNTKYGVELEYSKKIPMGQFYATYKYDKLHKDYLSSPSNINVIGESYSLSDNGIVLLHLPDINITSVVVKDTTGTIIYLNNIDYLLIPVGKYVEIRRIPGGSIANNATVLIDYVAIQPGSYNYDANSHILKTGFYLFKNLLSISYRFSTQNYSNQEQTEYVTLNHYTQNIIGGRLDFKIVNLGAEYESYQSNIIPYKMTRYYFNFLKNFGRKVNCIFNTNFQSYEMLNETDARYQSYFDASGKIIYNLFQHTKLNVDVTYRKQTGRKIDLELFTTKAEIISKLNKLNLILGAELYKRNYVEEKLYFKSAYFKIERLF